MKKKKNKRPVILVTNDDGIAAPGIKALISVAKKFGKVLVVAPDSPQSGQGHAITLEKPLHLKEVDIFKGIEAYECSGTPADCVKLAKHVIMKDKMIDLCISGINHGSNASVNIIYSGTMSAAMEASLEGVDSIGFSLLDYSMQADFEPCKKYVKQIVKQVLNNGLPKGVVLNVNIPKLSEEEIKGVKVCRQANAHWEEEFDKRVSPMGREYFWLTGKFVNEDKGEDTDEWALSQGYVSVVPTQFDLTAHHYIQELNSWELNKK